MENENLRIRDDNKLEKRLEDKNLTQNFVKIDKSSFSHRRPCSN